MPKPVSAADRVRDAIALALLAGGAALYWYATLRMRAMARGEVSAAPGQSYVALTERFHDMARLGLVLAAVGAAVTIWAFWSHARARRGSGDPPTHPHTSEDPPAR